MGEVGRAKNRDVVRREGSPVCPCLASAASVCTSCCIAHCRCVDVSLDDNTHADRALARCSGLSRPLVWPEPSGLGKSETRI